MPSFATLLNSGSDSPNSGRDLFEKKEEEVILFQWTRDFFAHSYSFFQGGGKSGSRRSKTQFAIQVSMIYIYKEQVYDMLGHSTQEEEFSWKKKKDNGNEIQESHPTSFQKLKRTSSFHVSSMIASMETHTNQNHESKKKNTHHDTLKNSIHTNHSHGRNSSSSGSSSQLLMIWPHGYYLNHFPRRFNARYNRYYAGGKIRFRTPFQLYLTISRRPFESVKDRLEVLHRRSSIIAMDGVG